jgi:hypothetical protein
LLSLISTPAIYVLFFPALLLSCYLSSSFSCPLDILLSCSLCLALALLLSRYCSLAPYIRFVNSLPHPPALVLSSSPPLPPPSLLAADSCCTASCLLTRVRWPYSLPLLSLCLLTLYCVSICIQDSPPRSCSFSFALMISYSNFTLPSLCFLTFCSFA